MQANDPSALLEAKNWELDVARRAAEEANREKERRYDELMRANAALQASEERLKASLREESRLRAEADASRRDAEQARDILANATAVMTDGFAVFDPDDRLMQCNAAFALPYGQPPEELVGLTFSELQRLPAFQVGLDLGGRDFETWLDWRLARHRTADGSALFNWVKGEAFYVREHRTKAGWTVLVRNRVTELKRAEQELRAANDELARLANELGQSSLEIQVGRDLLRDTLENIAQAVAVFDGRRQLVASNEAFIRLAALDTREAQAGEEASTASALLPRPWEDLVAAKVVEWAGPDGRDYELAARVTPAANLVVTYSDVTERKRTERLKDEFISTVSHELRTPLTSIIGALDLIRNSSASTLPPYSARLLEIAHRNSQRLSALVDDILESQRLQSGRLHFNFSNVDIDGLLDRAVEAHQPYAQQFHVTLRVLRRPGRPVAVRADADRLMQVMGNLLSNAAKFSPCGSVVDIEASEDEETVTVSVRDRGAGIPDSFTGQIFQRFAQAERHDARQVAGTGLGLSIAKAIVEAQGGEIGFESPLRDGGTRFWFRLPRA